MEPAPSHGRCRWHDLHRFGGERPIIERLLEEYDARREDAALFAQIDRVLLLQDPASGVGIDLWMAGFDYERNAIERSTKST